ncbi:MAG TPA: chemotaxis protein CheW [Macromonas sp.]|nr:chemotaxis protein CheW [Macromonas sp.]
MSKEASPLPIDTYLPYMRDVSRCEDSLHELNLMWRMIESSAKMNCPNEAQTILPTMAATRAGFTRLEEELVRSLVGEKVSNVMDAIGTKAQYVIDIVVRNLYERTADVGFLATDRELCEFVARQNTDVEAIRARLQSYRDKYTVYTEILLVDVEGNVLVQIDPTAPVEGSSDPLIQEALASDTFVETFRETDLRPGKGEVLSYSRRMMDPTTGKPVGVLVLFFGFKMEMAGIFRSHRDPEGRANMLLLDAANRVIASADEHWIPRGAVVPVNLEQKPQLMLYAGREYLVSTSRAEGYQGYMGPSGWQGQVMIPIDLAFRHENSNNLAQLCPDVAAGLLSHARTFSPPLHEVITATETIRRVVWNGQVITAGQRAELHRLKTILDQISETGARSNALFSQSIKDLYETVLQSNLQQIGFEARLLVDLLDRNLYERADDCRWWALTPELRHVLAMEEPAEQQLKGINGILAYIHSLYTVYTRLYVYDRQGRILANSHTGNDQRAIGQHIDASTLQAVLKLDDEQKYHVSPFEVSELSDGKPTYIYHAAIRHPDNERDIVGGIGIAFDSERELAAMLHGGLGSKTDSNAYFVDRGGRIIASTDARRPVGSVLELDADLLSLPNGQVSSRIVVHDGQYATMGCSTSQGYREFKVSDGYREDVLSVVITPLGEERSDQASLRHSADDMFASDSLVGGTEFATFYVGNTLYALPAIHVQEALPASEMTSTPAGGHPCRVGMLTPKAQGSHSFIWVFDLSLMLRQHPTPLNGGGQIVVVRLGDTVIGLLVDELHGVPEFTDEKIIPSPFSMGGKAALIQQFIKAGGGKTLIAVLDTDMLSEQLFGVRQAGVLAA